MAEITPKSCKSGHLPTNSQVCCILILKTGSNICTLSHIGLFLFKGPDYRTLLVANRFHKSLHFVDFNFLAISISKLQNDGTKPQIEYVFDIDLKIIRKTVQQSLLSLKENRQIFILVENYSQTEYRTF